MRIKYLFVLFSLWCLNASGQKTIHFASFDGAQKISPDPEHYLQVQNGIGLKQMRFYISGIQFDNGKGKVWKESDSYHLIDLASNDSVTVELPKDFHPANCSFFVGIDSLTNVSGSQIGDLDPMNGMYWTWQSGYINVKLEGMINQHGQQTEFEYHLGGYAGEQLSMQAFTAPIVAQDVHISIDLDRFLKAFDPSSLHHIMSPGKNAVKLSSLLISAFKMMDHD